MKVEESNFSKRTFKILTSIGIKTLEELSLRTSVELYNIQSIPCIGKKTLTEIKNVLKSNGLSLTIN